MQQQKIVTPNDLAVIIGGPMTTETGVTIVIPSPDDQFDAAIGKLRELMRKEGQVHVRDVIGKHISESEMKLRRAIFDGIEFPLLELQSAWARQRRKSEALTTLAEMSAAEAKKNGALKGTNGAKGGTALVPVSGKHGWLARVDDAPEARMGFWRRVVRVFGGGREAGSKQLKAA